MTIQREAGKVPDQIPPTPGRCCDIVMKGGVTSGVVYPLAVCELAKEYRFVNVGGTSAGAIAASLTAAAEYKRRNGGIEGFTKGLMTLPQQLGSVQSNGQSLLVSLFQPTASVRSIYDALIGVLKAKGSFQRVLACAGGVLRISPIATVVGALIWFLLLLAVRIACQGPVNLLTVPLLLLLSLLLVAVPCGPLISCVRKTGAAIAANGYGMCSGYIHDRKPGVPKPLTEWLADLLDDVAGKPDRKAPLTFGDLWGLKPQTSDASQTKSINLQMMTTNLTHGRPYQLPFEQGGFYFSPAEFRELFPARIVDWMVAHSDRSSDTRYRSLPEAQHLPVVVATRMSLSFPLLVSAIPLYAVDWSRKKNKEKRETAELERCWFSDGGICSNFPVHFFDSPIPRWPTFAINLRPFHPDFPREADERKNVWMPRTNGEGILEQWMRFQTPSGSGSILEFLGAILSTMQNWMDNTQLKVPGYRDRVAHVYLAGDEGGLNLDMEEDVIQRLSTRGRIAGERLRNRFTGHDPDSELTWDNHRWVRYRSTMTLLENYLHAIAHRYEAPRSVIESSYPDLVSRTKGSPPTGYPLEPAQQVFAEDVSSRIVQLVHDWDAMNQSFEEGTPKPIPELRIRPHT